VSAVGENRTGDAPVADTGVAPESPGATDVDGSPEPAARIGEETDSRREERTLLEGSGETTSVPNANEKGDERPVDPAEWLDEVEGRLARAERLTAATDADEAREIVDSLGGLDAVRGLQAQLDADREQLDALERRTSSLADRLGEVEVPLATLERIA